MKTCPNCNAELEENFQLCWNCNFSLSENRIVEIQEDTVKRKKINCLRCDVPMQYSGNFKFHEGTRFGFLGNLFEAFVNRETFDIYLCPKCGKVEFFSPQAEG